MAKVDLKIDWCSHKAAKYACENWHYSGCIPRFKLVKIGAWENGEYIGCVIYSWGATSTLVRPYGLEMIEGCELTRVALTKHISPVSQILALSLKFLKRSNPGLRLVVSFADPEQNHHGGIYQATNWLYCGTTSSSYCYIDKKGRRWHARNVGNDLRKAQIMVLKNDTTRIKQIGKHRYLMPLDKEMKEQIAILAKPYPKRVKQAMTSNHEEQRQCDTDLPAPKEN